MGSMPPYDPFADGSLAWAIARVRSIVPPRPTWSVPATVALDVEEALRGSLPPAISVVFGPPREAGQTYFYLERDRFPPKTPDDAARLAADRAQLDATPVEIPDVGSRIVVWLAETADRGWDVPTLRSLGSPVPPTMRSRWLEADEVTVALVRSRVR